MRKKNHHDECNIHGRGFRGCKKTHTHMMKSCGYCFGFRNGENGRKTTMMNATHVIMVSNATT
jgi:hypothetical protein